MAPPLPGNPSFGFPRKLASDQLNLFFMAGIRGRNRRFRAGRSVALDFGFCYITVGFFGPDSRLERDHGGR
jgi:hypothetical protein